MSLPFETERAVAELTWLMGEACGVARGRRTRVERTHLLSSHLVPPDSLPNRSSQTLPSMSFFGQLCVPPRFSPDCATATLTPLTSSKRTTLKPKKVRPSCAHTT